MKQIIIRNIKVLADAKSEKEAIKIINLINTTLQEANLNCQPQLILEQEGTNMASK